VISKALPFLLLFALAACGAPSGTAAANEGLRPYAPDGRYPAAGGTAVPADPCAGKAAGLEVSAPDLDLVCRDGIFSCSGKLTIALLNCGDEPVEVERFEFGTEERAQMLVEFDPRRRLLRGERFQHEISFYREREYELKVGFRAAPGAELSWTGPLTVRVTNSAREAAMKACDACNGIWGAAGLLGREGCSCQTKDAGKTCHDGDECEGLCLFDHFEMLEEPKPLTCKNNTCSARLGVGVPVGRCSDRTRLFGCLTLIRRGASKEPPQVAPFRAPRICID